MTTSMLERPGGRIAYDVSGDGRLVVCVPGMGDLRASYRFLRPALVTAGFRVATMDLRGHGDSDASFDSYDDEAAGADVVALVRHLGGPAVLVGNSMGGAAVTLAAARAPELVAGLVLLAPFVRNAPVGRMALLAFRAALLRPWGPSAWSSYFASLFPGRRPPDLDQYRAQIRESMRRPGHWKAFVATTHTSHAPVEACLDDVRAPTLMIIGDRDRDFPDPAAEAEFVKMRLNAEVVLIAGAGHYPHVEYPEIVGPAVVRFATQRLKHPGEPATHVAA